MRFRPARKIGLGGTHIRYIRRGGYTDGRIMEEDT